MIVATQGKRISVGCRRGVIAFALLAVLAGCDEGGLGIGSAKPAGESIASARETKLVERDIEAPEVFQVTDQGLWDGRPSLGGVWVAHPDVKDPERVIIRNTATGSFVIGALFRRERSNPGPVIQVSSDAAEALGMLAGAPTQLNVTALRREEVAVEPDAVEDAPSVEETADLPAETPSESLAPDPVVASPLDAVAGAGAAIAAAEAQAAPPEDAAPAAPPAVMAAPTMAAPTPVPAPDPAPRRAAAELDKAYLQIGIFSVEANAEGAAETLRKAGMVPTVRKQTTSGKDFYRVLVGPTTSVEERQTLLGKIKSQGFNDAYAVDS